MKDITERAKKPGGKGYYMKRKKGFGPAGQEKKKRKTSVPRIVKLIDEGI